MSAAAHRPTKTMVVIGEEGAGKATLMGNLMYKCGGVDMRLLEILQRDGINEYDQVIAYCRSHDIEPSFEARHAKVLLREEAADAGIVDILVCVLDATVEALSTKIATNGLGARNFLIAVNKMDACDWSEESYVQALEKNKTQLTQHGLDLEKWSTKQQSFEELTDAGYTIRCSTIPISALHGENMLDKSSKCPWFFANSPPYQTLVEAINAASHA